MKKITKEHRVLDDTDLTSIDNTFKLFKSEFESSRVKFETELQSTRSELQNSREELKYSRDALNGKLNFILWFIGIGFAVLGILIKTS